MPLAHLTDWCAYTSNISPSFANVLFQKQTCVIKPPVHSEFRHRQIAQRDCEGENDDGVTREYLGT